MQQSEALKRFNDCNKESISIFHEIALKLDMSDSGFDILYSICVLGNGCSQKEISRVSYLSKQTVHSSIKHIQQLGYIRFEQGKGRDKRIFLTESGEAIVRERVMPVLECENAIFDSFDEAEKEMLFRLLGFYNARMRLACGQLKDYRRNTQL